MAAPDSDPALTSAGPATEQGYLISPGFLTDGVRYVITQDRDITELPGWIAMILSMMSFQHHLP